MTSAATLGAVLLFINRTSRAVITDNVQSARVFEEELAGLGFQLKERPWYDDPGRVVAELGHNKQVATDGGLALAPGRDELAPLRGPALPADQAGAAAAPRAGPDADPGRRGDLPQLRPGRDRGRRRRPPGAPPDPRGGRAGRPPGRRRRPPGPLPPAELQGGPDPSVARRSSAVGRRHGLCASVTRTVSFGPVSAEVPRRRTAWPRWSTPPASTSPAPARPSARSSAAPGGSTRSSTTPTSGPSTTTGASSATPPARSPSCPTARSSSTPTWPSAGARASARPARRTPSSIDAARLRGRHRGPELAQARGRRQGLPDPPAGHPGTINSTKRVAVRVTWPGPTARVQRPRARRCGGGGVNPSCSKSSACPSEV